MYSQFAITYTVLHSINVNLFICCDFSVWNSMKKQYCFLCYILFLIALLFHFNIDLDGLLAAHSALGTNTQHNMNMILPKTSHPSLSTSFDTSTIPFPFLKIPPYPWSNWQEGFVAVRCATSYPRYFKMTSCFCCFQVEVCRYGSLNLYSVWKCLSVSFPAWMMYCKHERILLKLSPTAVICEQLHYDSIQ